MTKLKNCHWLISSRDEEEFIANYLMFTDLRRTELDTINVNVHVEGTVEGHPTLQDGERVFLKITELSAINDGCRYSFIAKSSEDGVFELDIKEAIETFTNK